MKTTQSALTRAQDEQLELWTLLGEQVARYTMGDSSSVPLETAEELLLSLHYTLGLAPEDGALRARLETGRQRLLEIRDETLSLWRAAKLCAVDNAYYRSTLKAVDDFFPRYDAEFFAHRTSPDLDYPLLLPVSETLCGVSYMRAYIDALLIENRFLQGFNAIRVERLLCAAVPAYKEMFFNIAGTVLDNAAGLAILRKDVRALDISADDRETLGEILASAPEGALGGILQSAAQRICGALDAEDANAVRYAEEYMESLRPRLESALHAGDLSHVFITFLPENIGLSAYEAY